MNDYIKSINKMQNTYRKLYKKKSEEYNKGFADGLEFAEMEYEEYKGNNNEWVSVKDRLPEPETMCCVTVKVRVIDFDYKTNKQIGKEYINNHMTEGYYNESMQWELELNDQLVCEYYGKYGIHVWEDKISNEKFENGENKIVVDIVSDNKKEITRTTIEVLAWYPIMTEPYIQSEVDD